uniref:Uncharacterized protein n=1 Tax=Rhipicephalus zambeziensis TaxID=60191 RepID=A0A224YEI9_9ACAR
MAHTNFGVIRIFLWSRPRPIDLQCNGVQLLRTAFHPVMFDTNVRYRPGTKRCCPRCRGRRAKHVRARERKRGRARRTAKSSESRCKKNTFLTVRTNLHRCATASKIVCVNL